MPKPRKKKTRSVGRVFHIVFEDKKSSRYYVQGYKKDKGYGNEIVLEPHKHTDPKHLIEDAKKIKKDNPNDVVWAVYDVESPRQRDVSREHAPALQNAINAGIKVALSTVSYETWILLHHTYSTKAFPESNVLEKHIRDEHDNDYTKSGVNIYTSVKSKVPTALANAKKLKRHNDNVNAGKKRYEINPYTEFHLLLEDIDEFVAELKEN